MDYGFLAIFTGLASAVCYGVSDFGGGLASRRREALMVVLVSQAAGMVLLLLIAFFLNEPLPPTADLFASAAAGILGTIGLVRFYQELALGRMGIIAPAVAVVTVTIPVLFSAFTEGMPQANQIAGILLATRASVSPFSGAENLMIAFEVVVLGRLGSTRGALLAGIFLGIVQIVSLRFDSNAGLLYVHLSFFLILLFWTVTGKLK